VFNKLFLLFVFIVYSCKFIEIFGYLLLKWRFWVNLCFSLYFILNFFERDLNRWFMFFLFLRRPTDLLVFLYRQVYFFFRLILVWLVKGLFNHLNFMLIDIFTSRPFMISEIESSLYNMSLSFSRQKLMEPVFVICPHFMDRNRITSKPLWLHLLTFCGWAFKFICSENVYFKRLWLGIIMIHMRGYVL